MPCFAKTLEADKEEYFFVVDWYESWFDLFVTTGSTAWEGRGLHPSSQSSFPVGLYDAWFKNAKKALTQPFNPEDPVTLTAKKCDDQLLVTWRWLAEGSKTKLIGNCRLPLAQDTTNTNRYVLRVLCNSVSSLKEALEDQQRSCTKLQTAYKGADVALNQVVKEMSKERKELINKFCAITNEQKQLLREVIAERDALRVTRSSDEDDYAVDDRDTINNEPTQGLREGRSATNSEYHVDTEPDESEPGTSMKIAGRVEPKGFDQVRKQSRRQDKAPDSGPQGVTQEQLSAVIGATGQHGGPPDSKIWRAISSQTQQSGLQDLPSGLGTDPVGISQPGAGMCRTLEEAGERLPGLHSGGNPAGVDKAMTRDILDHDNGMMLPADKMEQGGPVDAVGAAETSTEGRNAGANSGSWLDAPTQLLPEPVLKRAMGLWEAVGLKRNADKDAGLEIAGLRDAEKDVGLEIARPMDAEKDAGLKAAGRRAGLAPAGACPNTQVSGTAVQGAALDASQAGPRPGASAGQQPPVRQYHDTQGLVGIAVQQHQGIKRFTLDDGDEDDGGGTALPVVTKRRRKR